MQVLIVDDHPIVLAGLEAVVRFALDSAIVRTATNLEDALTAAGSRPGINLAILDLELPRCTGVEAVSRFKAAFPEPCVSVTSADECHETARAAFRVGAAGYMPKSLPVTEIIAALRVVASGGVYVPAGGFRQDASAARREGPPCAPAREGRITERQREILRLICRGLSNAAISRELEITEGTVKQHVHGLLRGLDVSSRTKAIATAARLGLLEVE
jgi:DNA-binding NarL/FixJ family response regulator